MKSICTLFLITIGKSTLLLPQITSTFVGVHPFDILIFQSKIYFTNIKF